MSEGGYGCGWVDGDVDVVVDVNGDVDVVRVQTFVSFPTWRSSCG